MLIKKYMIILRRQRINTAVSNTRKKIGRGIEGIGKRIIPEDFIHEAEKGKKEIKKEKIDVMKGTNKIEVNPKVQAEAKKMTKSQIEKRDEIADAISTREMNKRYGDKNVKYAIATKLAMKKKKKKGMCEAKVDKEKSPIYSLPRTQARNERRFGKKGSLEPQGFFGQKPSEAAELSKKRTDEHKAKRGVKTKGMKEEVLDEKGLIKDILNKKADVAYENRQVAMNPEKHPDPDESDKPYHKRSRAARMRDPKRGINSPAFKKFMADRGM